MEKTTSPLARDAMAYVLAGGRGSRLKELTDRRAKPAVYFGGKTRIIDFALSNALNSGIRRIGVATQYKAHSPDPPPAARLELPPARAQRELRHPAGQPARLRDAVVRRHRRRGLPEHRHHRRLRARIHGHPRRRPHLQDGLRADAAAARRPGRRRHRRLPRSAAHGGRPASASCMSTRRTRSSPSSRSPPTRPAFPASRTWRWPRWASTSSSTKFLIDLLRRDAADPGLQPRLRQGHHPLHRQERQGGRPPLRALLRALERRERRLLARRRHGRRLLGSQYRPDRHHPGARPLRPRLADLDLCRDQAAGKIRPRRGRPPRQRRLLARLRRLHRLGRVAPPQRWSSPACASTPTRRSTRRWCCPTCDDRPHAQLKRVVIDRGVRIPEGLVVGEDPRLDAKRFRRTEKGICLITQPMIDQLCEPDMMRGPLRRLRGLSADQDRRARRRRRRAAAGAGPPRHRRCARWCPAIPR